jgi:glycosyltransferase involved in cell wall biosynthesis
VTTTPAVSIVIPTRDRAARLRALLTSLAAQQGPSFEVIVVDNASGDDTLAVVAEADAAADAHIRAIHLPQPMGPAIARNRGWRSARAPFVVFTDDDVVARPGWLAALYGAHERDPEGVVQGHTEPDPRELDRLAAFSRTQLATGPGPWFQTCNIGYPTALLEQLGGFDETFWEAAGEDTDLGWRAIETGARVIYEPAAVNWHAVHQPGAWQLIRASQKWRLVVRNLKRHPALRASLHRGVFWKPSHERLLLGLVGLAVTRRAPLVAAAVLPYLLLQRTQHGSYAGTLAALPAHVALDSAEIVAMVRGSLNAGTLVL